MAGILACVACGQAEVADRDTPVPAAPPESTTGAAAPPASTRPAEQHENPLLTALRDTLRGRNPVIAHVAVIELRRLDPEYGSYVLLGYGIREGNFEGRFEDELFGLFVVNDSLTRILRAIDVLPTQRWRDYRVWISRFTADSVAIAGEGRTYGDQQMQRAYSRAGPPQP